MISGDTIFAGDSITVGYAPRFVQVDGRKFRLAYGGLDSAWILKQMKAADATSVVDLANPILHEAPKPTPLDLSSYKNLVLLIGTNDMGGFRSAAGVFANILATWQLAKKHGLKVFACTVPPFKGYASYQPSWDEKRHVLNGLIGAAKAPDGIVYLDQLLATSEDYDRLAAEFDSGDHLHPRPDRMGAVVQAQVEALQSRTPVVDLDQPGGQPTRPVEPQQPTQEPAATSSPAVGVASILLGCGILYWAFRKP